jgi:hypothetical protein
VWEGHCGRWAEQVPRGRHRGVDVQMGSENHGLEWGWGVRLVWEPGAMKNPGVERKVRSFKLRRPLNAVFRY